MKREDLIRFRNFLNDNDYKSIENWMIDEFLKEQPQPGRSRLGAETETINKYLDNKYYPIARSRMEAFILIKDYLEIYRNQGMRSVTDEEALEPIQNALYATGNIDLDNCNELANGILQYIKDCGYKIC